MALSGFFLSGVLWSGVKAQTGASVFDVRFGVNAKDDTRIVLDVSADPHYRVLLAKGEGGEKRLTVEIDRAAFDIGGRGQGEGKGIGHIGAYSYRLTDDDLARLDFRIEKTAVPKSVFPLEPKDDAGHYRLVIDLESASNQAFEAQLGKEYGPMRGGERLPRPAAKQVKKPAAAAPTLDIQPAPAVQDEDSDNAALAAAALGRARSFAALDNVPVPRVKPSLINKKKPEPGWNGRIVIIDAGHGGKDPGAIGAGGNYEKDVTLASARVLEKILKKRGYRVVMTRNDDTKIELEDRMPRRSKEAADLFISIHADSIDRADVRGASVYTLSRKGGLRLANQIDRSKQQGDAVVGGVDLAAWESDISKIVADINTSAAQVNSAILAEQLIQHLDGRVPMVNNTHRQENLKVLLAPDIPAVLLELGFMSNIHDEANLIRPEWRQGVMTYVADAIDDYIDTLPPVRHASLVEGAQ